MYGKVCPAVIRSGRHINKHQISAAEITYKSRRRIHCERGSADNQRVTLLYGRQRTGYRPVIEIFAVQHNIRFYYFSAFAMRNAFGLENILRTVAFSAFKAVVSVNASVQFVNRLTSCRRMKPVNILRYDRSQLSCLFKLSQLQMRLVRLCVKAQHFLTVKLKEFFGMFKEIFVA